MRVDGDNNCLVSLPLVARLHKSFGVPISERRTPAAGAGPEEPNPSCRRHSRSVAVSLGIVHPASSTTRRHGDGVTPCRDRVLLSINVTPSRVRAARETSCRWEDRTRRASPQRLQCRDINCAASSVCLFTSYGRLKRTRAMV
jgi:hypothetical protein